MDAGDIYYRISGLLGGYRTQDDEAELVVEFIDGGGGVLHTDSIGPVAPENRNNETDLRHRESWGEVPASARSVRVVLISRYYDGTNNVDGYADELSFTLHSSRP